MMPIPAGYTSPKVPSAKERAFQQIQEWIIDGTLLPGEKINDALLAKAIGVSRTPVREALQILGLQGFVAMKPGVATTIIGTDPDDINKLLPPLAALEGLAAELAAPAIDAETLESLRTLNKDFDSAIRSGDAFLALKVDEQFHALIVGVCDNRYINSAIAPLQAHVRRLFFQKSITLTAESVLEHAQLIDALSRRDAETAGNVARGNWLRPIALYV